MNFCYCIAGAGHHHHLMFGIDGEKTKIRNSPAGAALCRHAGVILEDDVAVVVKVKKRQRRQDVGHAARSRHFRMAADGVNDTLDSCVIRRIQLLIYNPKEKNSLLQNNKNRIKVPISSIGDSI
jgi:hypothetical protein